MRGRVLAVDVIDILRRRPRSRAALQEALIARGWWRTTLVEDTRLKDGDRLKALLGVMRRGGTLVHDKDAAVWRVADACAS